MFPPKGNFGHSNKPYLPAPFDEPANNWRTLECIKTIERRADSYTNECAHKSEGKWKQLETEQPKF